MSKYEVPDFPKVIRIEPASACNLKCSHCPTGTVDMDRGVMKEDVFLSICEELKENIDKIKVVVLYHGGEPLMNRKFGFMVKTLKDIGVPFVKTVSNGMLMKQEHIDSIVESGLDAIEFSLDGESPEQNNMIRRRSDFDIVVSNIRKLIDAKKNRSKLMPDIALSTTQFVKEKSRKAPGEAPVPEYLKNCFSKELNNGEISDFKAVYAMEWPVIEIDSNLYESFQVDGEDLDYCDHLYNTITIRSNGEVVACCYDLTSAYVTGSISDKTIKEIWKDKRYNLLRSTVENRNYLKHCGNCNTVRPNKFLLLKDD